MKIFKRLRFKINSFLYDVKCEWRLYWNLCPICNSDAPKCDRCNLCRSSREYPLSKETKEKYRYGFHNHYDRNNII